jgi:hypothetical protein
MAIAPSARLYFVIWISPFFAGSEARASDESMRADPRLLPPAGASKG